MDYKLIKNIFFDLYKSKMNYSRLMIDIYNKTYEIKILRNQIDFDKIKITIIINQEDITDGMLILNSEEANNLIEAIRLDFKENHYITYSTTNPKELIQTIQNTNFTLQIQLLDAQELENALSFNASINNDASRHKVLKRN